MPSARTPSFARFFSPQRLRLPRKGQRHFQVKQPAFNFADLARDFRKSVGEQSLKTPLTLRSFLENEIAHKPGAPPAVRGEGIVLSDSGCETGISNFIPAGSTRDSGSSPIRESSRNAGQSALPIASYRYVVLTPYPPMWSAAASSGLSASAARAS